MKARLAGNLKPGVYQAYIWPESKEPALIIATPHSMFDLGCRVQVASTGIIQSLEWLTLFNPNHRLYKVRRLM